MTASMCAEDGSRDERKVANPALTAFISGSARSLLISKTLSKLEKASASEKAEIKSRNDSVIKHSGRAWKMARTAHCGTRIVCNGCSGCSVNLLSSAEVPSCSH